MNLYELMKKRRSIRKYLPDCIPDEDIEKLISAAITAPSGCNSQCWKFIAVKNPQKIAELAVAVEAGVRHFYNDITDENFLASRIKQTTFFKSAPFVILVYLTEMKYHDQRVTDYYADKGMNGTEMLSKLGSPDILSVGAAVENLLLTAEEMGLGACWMNDPVVAEKEINKLFSVPDEHRLLSVIPVGKPAYVPREKVMKPLAEVFEIV